MHLVKVPQRTFYKILKNRSFNFIIMYCVRYKFISKTIHVCESLKKRGNLHKIRGEEQCNKDYFLYEWIVSWLLWSYMHKKAISIISRLWSMLLLFNRISSGWKYWLRVIGLGVYGNRSLRLWCIVYWRIIFVWNEERLFTASLSLLEQLKCVTMSSIMRTCKYGKFFER